MFKIFAESHKKIGYEIYNSVLEDYDIELDKKSLLWGSIAPDILPKYKLIRHYKDESMDFVVNEIIDIIYDYRDILKKDEIDAFTLKNFSRRLGVVAHYLTDYTCLPHAKRWTFQDSMFKHIKYESKLNEIIVDHEFNKDLIEIEDIELEDFSREEMKSKISDYIDHIVEEEYSREVSFENDINFALSLNIKVFYFVLDTIEEYSEAYNSGLILQLEN